MSDQQNWHLPLGHLNSERFSTVSSFFMALQKWLFGWYFVVVIGVVVIGGLSNPKFSKKNSEPALRE